MQIGIAAWLRNLAIRCNEIGRRADDQKTKDALASLSVELANKAEVLEENFRVERSHGRSHDGH